MRFTVEKNFIMRVRSWLRMNAGGTLNTCKSSGGGGFGLQLSGGRVRNAWVICPIPGDNSEKSELKPHKPTESHGSAGKTPVVWDEPASD